MEDLIPICFPEEIVFIGMSLIAASLRYAIVAKNFVISNGSPGRLAKLLQSENIYRKYATIFMAR